MSCYLVQEDDGTSRFTLEDGSGFILLEECEPPTPGDEPWRQGGDRRMHHEVIRRHPPSEDDIEELFTVLLNEV